MKTLAISTSALVLLIYLTLTRVNPAFGLFSPRGGIATLAISLAIANMGIWLAARPNFRLSTRFQLAVAGWIWIFVQGGGLVYLYTQSGEA